MIAWICPLHRGERIPRVLANAGRQVLRRGWTLVVVENGEAIGEFPRSTGAVVLRSAAQCHATARNVGLDWALQHGYTHVATHDSDDWYGSRWLLNVQDVFARGATVVGQHSFLVELSDSTIWRAKQPGKAGAGVHGGTLGFVLDEYTPRYRIAVNDDSHMVSDLAALGRRTTMLPPGGFLYRRSSDGEGHVWTATDKQLRRTLALQPATGAELWQRTPQL